MKKIDDTNNQVLNLGSLHEEIENDKKVQKKKKIPIILVLLGMILILLGVFFPKIEKALNLNQKEQEKPTQNIDNNNQELTCVTTNLDKTIGIKTKKATTYTFENDLLKKVKIVTTYTVIENNYDAGISNLSLYNNKYLELETTFATIEGVTTSHTLKKTTLTSTTTFELDKTDPTKIPQNKFITLSNTLNQEKKKIKEIEGKAGHICT